MLCGVLALQGAFAAHQRALAACGVNSQPIRSPHQLVGLDALILPGGESTTMVHLLHSTGLWQPVSRAIVRGLPVLATCAGLILLARTIRHHTQQQHLALLDVDIERNAYGRQIDSRPARLQVPALGSPPLPVFFIRAPRVLGYGKAVDVLAWHQGDPVLLRQQQILAATFHSELTTDTRLHRHFISVICGVELSPHSEQPPVNPVTQ